jgi:hypothetical protein
MASAGIWSFAKFRGQMPLIATTGITSWQTALKWTADCQAPRSGCQEYMRSGHACGNPLSNLYSWLGNLHDGYFICGNPQHTFERRAKQETEFQLLPFHIESSPV